MEHTDEAACRFFKGLGACANVAYSLDIVCRKAEFITLKHDEALCNPEVQRRDDVVCITVVICVLYKLKQKVGFFVVQVARESIESVRKRMGSTG